MYSYTINTRRVIMKLATVTINDIEFDAYYEVDITRDMYGTGDSPTSIDVNILELSLLRDATNLIDIIDEYWIDKAEAQIREIEYLGE